MKTNIKKIDSKAEDFFLALLRVAILVVLAASLVTAAYSVLVTFKLPLNIQEIDFLQMDEVKYKKNINNFLVLKYKEDEVAARIDEGRILTKHQKRFDDLVNEINEIYYDYYNNFKKTDFTIEAWTERNPDIAFKKSLSKNMNASPFSECVYTSTCSVSDYNLNKFFEIISYSKTLSTLALMNNGYIEIIKDEQKNDPLYANTFGNLIKSVSLKYIQEATKLLTEQINDKQKKLELRDAQIAAYLLKALYALGAFFSLAMLLLIVKIERNLRK